MATLDIGNAEMFYQIMNELIYFTNSRFKLISNFPRPGKERWKQEA